MSSQQSPSLKKQFYGLTPDVVLEGVEQAGFMTTGEYIQLNSYENRVFDIHLEPEVNPVEFNRRLIAKYYRPLRWSHEAILEEHFFLEELKSQGIPAVAPIQQKNQSTLSAVHGLYLALFPKAFGRMPQELSLNQLRQVGRLLARLHNIGEQRASKFRPALTAEEFGWPNLDLLLDWIAPEVSERYEIAAEKILEFLEDHLDESEFIRIHGDCHKGNLLLTDFKDRPQEFFLVDFDDFCMGPPAQDFWMLFSGDQESSVDELEALLSGYEELRHFDRQQMKLFPALRGLRIISYAAWIAKRWEDPNFPRLFPNYETYIYWAEEAEALEKIAWSL